MRPPLRQHCFISGVGEWAGEGQGRRRGLVLVRPNLLQQDNYFGCDLVNGSVEEVVEEVIKYERKLLRNRLLKLRG